MVFEGSSQLVEFLRILTRRPRLREAPRSSNDVRVRGLHRGIPLVYLRRAEDDGALLRTLARHLARARPRRMPHVVYQYPADPGLAVLRTGPATHADALDLAETLLAISKGLARGANASGGRIRFARFGLVCWLIRQNLEAEDADSDTVLRSRLRRREQARARYLKLFSDELPEFLDGPATRWAKFARLVPPVAFLLRLWAKVPGVGQEYRWLLRQPYLAPRDPGTVLGFAERLTIEQRTTDEDPEQVLRLLVCAFLSDVARAYRRPPWRPRGARRTTYPVVFLDRTSASNNGFRLLRLINDVRNDRGDFDPLVFVSAGEEFPPDAVAAPAGGTIARAAGSVDAYDDWCARIHQQSRARGEAAWYLPIIVPAPPVPAAPGTPGPDVRRPPAFVIEPPPFWARRWIAPLTVLALVGSLGTGAVLWERDHCAVGEWKSWQTWVQPSLDLDRYGAECIGLAEGFGVFAPGDESLQSVDDKLAVQNEQALRLHGQTGRPLLTLVYATFVAIGETADNTEQRLELAGMLAAQAEQNDLGSSGGGSEPLLRFLVANGGTDMRQHPRMVELIARVADHDPTFAGVVGLDKSSQNTKDLIRNLGSAGFPVLSATLSADGLGQGATNYFQMAPSNSEQAAAIRTFADRRVKDARSKGKPASKQVTIICPNDSSSLYSQTLMQGLLRRFGSGGWTVNVHAFTPAIADPGPAGDPTPCGDDPVPITSLREDAEALSADPAGGLVVFAGRSTDFQLFVQGAGSRLQIIADDDVSSIVARRKNNRLIDGRSFRYVSFAYGGKDQSHQQPYSYIHSDLGGLVGIDAQVDGHAAGAYEAIQAYLRVGRDILARGQQINPALLIGQFPAETVPGNDTGRIATRPSARAACEICILRVGSNLKITRDPLSTP